MRLVAPRGSHQQELCRNAGEASAAAHQTERGAATEKGGAGPGAGRGGGPPQGGGPTAVHQQCRQQTGQQRQSSQTGATQTEEGKPSLPRLSLCTCK